MYKASVLNHFGGTVKTAGALGISHSAVCQWVEIVPEKQALRIERITKGHLKYDPSLYIQNNKTI
ncbi:MULTISPECIES: Cro/CI family transcriptional regulator [Providencia]|uniref:Cro/CI family transcriptional regulator n=1 Tax=Providencia TaxID=586 RepID=UPI00234BCCA2|nr:MULTISPECIES: Cro/CI family transcriptional regulator [Providencia]